MYGGVQPSPVNGTAVLVVSLLGLVCCQILGPVAWIMGNSALNTLNQYPGADQSQRGLVTTGRIIGMVGTGLLVLCFLLGIISGISGGGSHRYR